MKRFLWLTVFFYGCSTTSFFIGKYSSKEGVYNITLNSDSTFSYYAKFQFKSEFSSGHWTTMMGKKEITLNSFNQNKILPLQIFKEGAKQVSNDRNSVNFDINMPDSEQKFYSCLIFANDKLVKRGSCDTLKHIEIDSLTKDIYFGITGTESLPTRFLDTIYSEKYRPKTNPAENVRIKISYVDSFFNYKVFNNVTLHKNGKGDLYMSDFDDQKKIKLIKLKEVP